MQTRSLILKSLLAWNISCECQSETTDIAPHVRIIRIALRFFDSVSLQRGELLVHSFARSNSLPGINRWTLIWGEDEPLWV